MREILDAAATTPPAASRVTRATLAAQVGDAIRADIIAGTFEPGQRLRASDLAGRYGVSATPLREALQHLAAQNLVELGPRLGATVAAISKTDLRDVYWLRGLLEGAALERSIAHGDAAWERGAVEAFEAYELATAGEGHPTDQEILAWAAVHRRFHDALFAACDSPWLLRFVAVLSHHSERYRMLSHRRALRHPLQEHREILDAALARDVERAKNALMRHLGATVELLDTELPDSSRG